MDIKIVELIQRLERRVRYLQHEIDITEDFIKRLQDLLKGE